MPDRPFKIDMMTKVQLELKVPDHAMIPVTLIYGVGSCGITPFEKELFGKTVGDRLSLEISPENGCEILGPLKRAIDECPELSAFRCVEVVIVDVARATDREIIAAMADGAGCGDCDCGCGGHGRTMER